MGFARRATVAPTFTSLCSVLCALLLLPFCVSTAAQAQRSPYANIINDHFATVSNGPQNTTLVDVSASATEVQIQEAALRKARAVFVAQARSLQAPLQSLQKAGLTKPGAIYPLSQIVTVRRNGRLVVPKTATGRAVGNGTLTFKYTGFNATDTELIKGFIALAQPRIEAVYGKPAVSGEVEIINAGNLSATQITEVQRFSYGVYNASTNQIYLPIFDAPQGTLQALLLDLIFAYHGPAHFQYDAWEQGFARAAAAVVLRNPEFNSQYGMDDPSGNTLYSLMRYYDILNQQPLGNSTFFPPSQKDIPIDGQITVAKMLWARIGMSGAAWLKVYIENPNFFRDFNTAYYAQFTPGQSPSLAGNVPALKQIAASLLPNGVEGTAFNDWFARQYILDTSVSPGSKLYAFVSPGGFNAQGQQLHSVKVVYYRTETSGDESLQNGTAYGLYSDSSNKTVSFGAGSEQAAVADGEGSFTVATTNKAGTDAQRLTMDYSVGNLVARTYIPIGFDGDFQGVVLATNGATKVSVTETTLPPITNRNQTNQPIEGAAFGVALGAIPNDLGVVTVSTTDGTNTRTWRINMAGDAYYAILRDGATGGGVITRTKTFTSSQTPYLVSFPVQPLTTDVAEALSLPGTDFLLSFWNPLSASYETFTPNVPSVAPLKVGRGYWLKIRPQSGAAQATVQMTGTAPPTDTDLAIACSYGWNLIGSPFNTTTDITKVQVKYLQNGPIPWQSAVDQNLIAALPYGLNTTTGTYGTVDALAGTEWQGYWLRVLVPSGVTLLIPGPDAPTRAAQTRSLVPSKSTTTRTDWQVQFTARQMVLDRNATSSVTLGTASGASRAFDNRLDREEPPAVVPGVQMSFTNREFKTAGGRFVSDYRGTGDANPTWDVVVQSPTDGTVTLTWEGVSGLPRRANLVLVDTTTGERVALRSRSAFSFQASAGSSRAFQVISERSTTLPLQIDNIMTVTTRSVSGGAITVSYSVSRAADVQLELSTLSGKSISRQSAGRSRAAGLQRTVLAGRAQNGSALPPGPYLLTVTARDENGNQAQARRVVMMIQ